MCSVRQKELPTPALQHCSFVKCYLIDQLILLLCYEFQFSLEVRIDRQPEWPAAWRSNEWSTKHRSENDLNLPLVVSEFHSSSSECRNQFFHSKNNRRKIWSDIVLSISVNIVSLKSLPLLIYSDYFRHKSYHILLKLTRSFSKIKDLLDTHTP